jgi:DNA-binding ferritin-like protein (Dps family)
MNKVIAKVIGEKRQWRQYKARTRQLPENYRTAVEALERYLMYCGPGGDGVEAAAMFADLLDLFEQSAANGTPIREIVGDDPMEFVEAFVQNYSEGGYITPRVRERLTAAIASAAGEAKGKEWSSR